MTKGIGTTYKMLYFMGLINTFTKSVISLQLVFPSSETLRSNLRKIESKCFLIAGNENAIPYGDFREIRPDHHVGWQGIHQLQ